MAVNKFFNHLTNESEQKLFDDLVVEDIQVSGVNIWYIPRKDFEFDPILGEPKRTTFERAFEIEAYMPDNAQFEGEGSIMSKFGMRFDQSTNFLVARTQFDKLGTRLPRPLEGDLIYLGNGAKTFVNTFFEINAVPFGTPTWAFGKNRVYKLVCTTFIPSYEQFDTSIPAIDNSVNIDNQTEVAYGINDALERKKSLVSFNENNPFSNL